jgi:hypothetical protein
MPTFFRFEFCHRGCCYLEHMIHFNIFHIFRIKNIVRIIPTKFPYKVQTFILFAHGTVCIAVCGLT